MVPTSMAGLLAALPETCLSSWSLESPLPEKGEVAQVSDPHGSKWLALSQGGRARGDGDSNFSTNTIKLPEPVVGVRVGRTRLPMRSPAHDLWGYCCKQSF